MKIAKSTSSQNRTFLEGEVFEDQSCFAKLPIEIISSISLKLQGSDSIHFRSTCKRVDLACRDSVTSVTIASANSAGFFCDANYKRYSNLGEICINATPSFELKDLVGEYFSREITSQRHLWDQSILSAANFKFLKHIGIDYPYFEEPHLILLANEMPFLKRLALKNVGLGSLESDFTGKFKKLKMLTFLSSKLSDQSASKLLKAMTELDFLRIGQCKALNGKGLETISLKKLSQFRLNLHRDSFTVDSTPVVEFLFRSPLLESIEISSPNLRYSSKNSPISVSIPPLYYLKTLILDSFHMKSCHLKKILISSTKIEYFKLKHIALESLSLSNCDLNWPNFHTLDLANSDIEDANFLALIHSSNSLKKVSVQSCKRLTDCALSDPKMRSVNTLILRNLSEIGNGGFNQLISQLKKIEVLALDMPQISELSSTPDLVNLRWLGIHRSLTENAIGKLLTNSRHLETLFVNSAPISFSLMAKIFKKCPHLKSVRLINTPISQEQLNSLKGWLLVESLANETPSQCAINCEGA